MSGDGVADADADALVIGESDSPNMATLRGRKSTDDFTLTVTPDLVGVLLEDFFRGPGKRGGTIRGRCDPNTQKSVPARPKLSASTQKSAPSRLNLFPDRPNGTSAY